MNKGQLIAEIAKKTKNSKAMTEKVVNSMLDTIKKSTKKDGVQLIGFGSFSSVKRKARMGRNPQTGKQIKIKASKTIKFKPGSDFKKKA